MGAHHPPTPILKTPEDRPLTLEEEVDAALGRVVERIMARTHASSGKAVFVDHVILRAILDEELQEIWAQVWDPSMGANGT
jgi:hypothetical protein